MSVRIAMSSASRGRMCRPTHSVPSVGGLTSSARVWSASGCAVTCMSSLNVSVAVGWPGNTAEIAKPSAYVSGSRPDDSRLNVTTANERGAIRYETLPEAASTVTPSLFSTSTVHATSAAASPEPSASRRPVSNDVASTISVAASQIAPAGTGTGPG